MHNQCLKKRVTKVVASEVKKRVVFLQISVGKLNRVFEIGHGPLKVSLLEQDEPAEVMGLHTDSRRNGSVFTDQGGEELHCSCAIVAQIASLGLLIAGIEFLAGGAGRDGGRGFFGRGTGLKTKKRRKRKVKKRR